MRIGFGLLLLLLLGILACPANALTVTDLKCEYRSQPLGIDVPKPRLSWALKSERRGDAQTAFRLLVASSRERLEREVGDLWDTGRVASAQSLHLVYAGKPLRSGQVCYWRVRAWDKDGTEGDWSPISSWEMGFLSPQDWRAQWINDGKPNPTTDADFYREDPAPLFRKEFTAERRVRRARLSISGIGYYEARLNGERVGDQVLAPGWTRYSARVFYSVYDVTRQMRRGANCLGVTLGNGWYNPLPLRMWGNINLREHLPVGRPRFIAQLEVEFTDGTRQMVASDPGWKVADGPLRFNSIYLGEVYDARREAPGWDRPGFDDSGWRRPTPATEPIGPLREQAQPPIRVTRVFAPVGLTEPHPGVHLFDMGQNFAGWVRLKLAAPAGTALHLRYGELIYKDGTLNPMTSVAGQIKGSHRTTDGKEESIGGPGAPNIAWQSDTYIAGGKGIETYTPRFTFHAFRYVELTGYPGKISRDMVTGLRLNADVERVGSFTCSNPLLNRIQEICDNTFLSNLFSVQSDCPHRERFGYGGDLAATSEAFLMNYDMATFYAKAVADWTDSALPNGMFTDTAPFVGIQYCGIAWAMAHPQTQRQLYQYYGDRRLVEEQFGAAQRWLDLAASQNPTFLVQDGLNDHEALESAPSPVMVTPLFAESARLVSELAALVGQDTEARKDRELQASILRAYNAAFVENTTGKVGPGTQASQAFVLALNIVPPEMRPAVFQRLVEATHTTRSDHLFTGIFGTKFALDTLSQGGRADLAYAVVNQKTLPGWGYMVENGATTLWEHWEGSDNTFSHNHPMFGSVSQWFYHWLGGICPAPDAVGFDRILLQPQVVGDLKSVQCRYRSVRGKIVCNWRREQGRLHFEIEIPVGATARFSLLASRAEQVSESGRPLSEAVGVTLIGREDKEVVIRLESGRYRFDLSTNP